MKQRDIHMKPLSEGIGLGSLKTVTGHLKKTDIDSSVMRQAHAAYAPGSVGSEIRRRPINRGRNSIIRFLSGVGTDLFVSTISFAILTLVGICAWQAGETGKLDVIAALKTIQQFLANISIAQMSVGMLILAVVWRALRALIGKF